MQIAPEGHPRCLGRQQARDDRALDAAHASVLPPLYRTREGVCRRWSRLAEEEQMPSTIRGPAVQHCGRQAIARDDGTLVTAQAASQTCVYQAIKLKEGHTHSGCSRRKEHSEASHLLSLHSKPRVMDASCCTILCTYTILCRDSRYLCEHSL